MDRLGLLTLDFFLSGTSHYRVPRSCEWDLIKGAPRSRTSTEEKLPQQKNIYSTVSNDPKIAFVIERCPQWILEWKTKEPSSLIFGMPLNTLTATCKLLIKMPIFSYYISLNSFMLIIWWLLNKKLKRPCWHILKKKNPSIHTTFDPC
jgi:hypothetical protein